MDSSTIGSLPASAPLSGGALTVPPLTAISAESAIAVVELQRQRKQAQIHTAAEVVPGIYIMPEPAPGLENTIDIAACSRDNEQP